MTWISLFLAVVVFFALIHDLRDQHEKYQIYEAALSIDSVRETLESIKRTNPAEYPRAPYEEVPWTKTIVVQKGGIHQVVFDENFQNIKKIILDNQRELVPTERPNYIGMVAAIIFMPALVIARPFFKRMIR